MPKVMAALPNIYGALCWTLQSLADPTARVPCSNAANIGEHKILSQANFAPVKIPLGGKSPRTCISLYSIPAQETAKHRAKFWLTSVERRRCSNDAKTRNLLKFVGVLQTCQPISAASGPKFTILWRHVGDILRFNKFFPIVNTCLRCEDIARQSCLLVHTWEFLAIFCVLYFQLRAAHFRHAF